MSMTLATTTSLAVEAEHGFALAPVAMHLRTDKDLHSTATAPPKKTAHHLNQRAPTMDEISGLELGRVPVHIIDREADSLGHFREWSPQGHLVLVRCDDRRVKHQGESVLLSEINERLDRELLFKDAGKALYRGKKSAARSRKWTLCSTAPTRRAWKANIARSRAQP